MIPIFSKPLLARNIARLKEFGVDEVVLSTCYMPDKIRDYFGDGSGLDVIAAIRQRRDDTRIIMLTGYGNIATAVNAVKLGAIDYLAKPADADDADRCALEVDAERDLRALGPLPGLDDLAAFDDPPRRSVHQADRHLRHRFALNLRADLGDGDAQFRARGQVDVVAADAVAGQQLKFRQPEQHIAGVDRRDAGDDPIGLAELFVEYRCRGIVGNVHPDQVGEFLQLAQVLGVGDAERTGVDDCNERFLVCHDVASKGQGC